MYKYWQRYRMNILTVFAIVFLILMISTSAASCAPPRDSDFNPSRSTTRLYRITVPAGSTRIFYHCDDWSFDDYGNLTLSRCDEGSRIVIVNPVNVPILGL